MLLLIFGIILFVTLIVYVAYIAIQKEQPEEQRPTIHTSGIYSVVRKSPRTNIYPAKPSAEEVGAFLGTLEIDNERKTTLKTEWEQQLEKNIEIVENGDRQGVEVYYYEPSAKCPSSTGLGSQKIYLTRTDIHNTPALIPPLHLGCKCELTPDLEVAKGKQMAPGAFHVFEEGKFTQPNWKSVANE